MGGVNESVIEPEKAKKKPEGEVLAADRAEPLGFKKEKKKKKKDKRSAPETLLQTQSIRQHVSGPEVHFHVDAEKLKSAIPTAEWWNAVRNLNKGEPFMWVDAKNKTTARFTPFFKDNVLDVVIQIESLKIGNRLEQLLGLTK